MVAGDSGQWLSSAATLTVSDAMAPLWFRTARDRPSSTLATSASEMPRCSDALVVERLNGAHTSMRKRCTVLVSATSMCVWMCGVTMQESTGPTSSVRLG